MKNTTQINLEISKLKYKENVNFINEITQLIQTNYSFDSSKFFDFQAINFISAVLTYLIVNKKHNKIIKINDVRKFFECIDLETNNEISSIYDFEGDLVKSSLMIQMEKLYFFNNIEVEDFIKKYINDNGLIMCKMCKNANKTFSSIVNLILNKIN